MGYSFPPDVQELIEESMALGVYASEDDLLREALRALDEQRRITIEEEPEVIEGVRRGLEEMKQGLGRPFEEFDAEFRAKRKIPNRDE
jgi:Arc/MetJ-type ribon-helix-helix transcriptional regulator